MQYAQNAAKCKKIRDNWLRKTGQQEMKDSRLRFAFTLIVAASLYIGGGCFLSVACGEGDKYQQQSENARLSIVRQNKALNQLLSLCQSRLEKSEVSNLSKVEASQVDGILRTFSDPAELYILGQTCLNYKYMSEGPGTVNNAYVFVYDYTFWGVCKKLIAKKDTDSRKLLSRLKENLASDDRDELQYLLEKAGVTLPPVTR